MTTEQFKQIMPSCREMQGEELYQAMADYVSSVDYIELPEGGIPYRFLQIGVYENKNLPAQ